MNLEEPLFRIAGIYLSVLPEDLLRYVIGAGGVFLAVNIVFAARNPWRQIRPDRPGWRQMRREIAVSLRTVAIFTGFGTLIVLGAQAGIVPVYTDIGRFGWPWVAVSTLILIVGHDAWFYWAHRLMHYPPLFRRFHRTHHLSHNPTPFTAYAFDIGEAAIQAAYLPLVLWLVPSHIIAILVFTTHMMLRNAIGHCGFEVFPARADGRPVFDWMTTVTHHDLHHAHAGRNLGLYFTWWDRWMGTEHPEYHARFARAAGRTARSA